jgi:RimJ/RimL family protein N-acetyltransferase
MPLPRFSPVSSPRTTLREVSAGDLPDLLEINGDPEVTRYLPYETWTSTADATAWLERMQSLGEGGSARQLVIARNDDGKVIGTALLFKYDEGSQRVELGYVLGRSHWGQGYASEALGTLLQHAFGVMGIRRVEAEVNPDNAASNALLQKLGFTHEGFLRARWVAKGETYGVNIYGLLADDHMRRPDRAES